MLMYAAEDSGDFLVPEEEEQLENGNRAQTFAFDLDHCWCPVDLKEADAWGAKCRKYWKALIVTASSVKGRQA